jgi:hypothetical protein
MTLALKPGDQSVEILHSGYFQINRLRSGDAKTASRRARGGGLSRSGGLYVVSFRNRGRDSRHGVRPVDLRSIVYASRFYRAGRSCTPITVPTTSTADFGTTPRTTWTRGCSWPGRLRGAPRPRRARRPPGSTWCNRAGRAHRRGRRHRADRARRRYRRRGIHRVDRQRWGSRTGRTDRTRGVDRARRRDGLHGVERQ